MEGKVLGAHERIDRTTALKMITRWSAEYVLKEEELGSVEPGKWADLVVLDRNYMTIPEEESSEIRLDEVGLKPPYRQAYWQYTPTGRFRGLGIKTVLPSPTLPPNTPESYY